MVNDAECGEREKLQLSYSLRILLKKKMVMLVKVVSKVELMKFSAGFFQLSVYVTCVASPVVSSTSDAMLGRRGRHTHFVSCQMCLSLCFKCTTDAVALWIRFKQSRNNNNDYLLLATDFFTTTTRMLKGLVSQRWSKMMTVNHWFQSEGSRSS